MDILRITFETFAGTTSTSFPMLQVHFELDYCLKMHLIYAYLDSLCELDRDLEERREADMAVALTIGPSGDDVGHP